jgi:hypothetical protein
VEIFSHMRNRRIRSLIELSVELIGGLCNSDNEMMMMMMMKMTVRMILDERGQMRMDASPKLIHSAVSNCGDAVTASERRAWSWS